MSAMTAVAGACGSHGKGAMEGADSEEAGPGVLNGWTVRLCSLILGKQGC